MKVACPRVQLDRFLKCYLGLMFSKQGRKCPLRCAILDEVFEVVCGGGFGFFVFDFGIGVVSVGRGERGL